MKHFILIFCQFLKLFIAVCLFLNWNIYFFSYLKSVYELNLHKILKDNLLFLKISIY